MAGNWNPYVHRGQVNIDADAVSMILNSFERLAQHLDAEQIYALTCTMEDLKYEGDAVACHRVIVGTIPKQAVPPEMIGSCEGHVTVFVLNPFFGEPARPVRIKVHGSGLVALYLKNDRP